MTRRYLLSTKWCRLNFRQRSRHVESVRHLRRGGDVCEARRRDVSSKFKTDQATPRVLYQVQVRILAQEAKLQFWTRRVEDVIEQRHACAVARSTCLLMGRAAVSNASSSYIS